MVVAKYNGPLEAATRLLERERQSKKYRKVILLAGKYKGREGVCKDITISETLHHGIALHYCIYVLRADARSTHDVLNTDGESRSFRPQEEFKWI